MNGLTILGERYENIIEILNHHYDVFYKRKNNHVYFDCTNYYFEIDKLCEDKQKEPSKENRKEPIIGMALLLDQDQIPLSMHLFPGNQSEKQKIREIIEKMKKTNHVKGKTIQVADTGLNCAKNIYEAVTNGEGYIYSQSVKKLSAKEKTWVDIQDQYIEKKEGSDIVFKIKSCKDDFSYSFVDQNGKKIAFKVSQKRVVYWSKKLEEKHIYEIDKEIEKLNQLSISGVKRKELGDLAKYIKIASIDDEGIVDETNINILIDYEKIKEDKKYCGYNMLITSEIYQSDESICNIYKNLWRIEESFQILWLDLYMSLQKKIFMAIS